MERRNSERNGIVRTRFYGMLAYWTLNLVLIFTEIRWHVLTRLTVWDLSQFRTLAPLLGKLFHSP